MVKDVHGIIISSAHPIAHTCLAVAISRGSIKVGLALFLHLVRVPSTSKAWWFNYSKPEAKPEQKSIGVLRSKEWVLMED